MNLYKILEFVLKNIFYCLVLKYSLIILRFFSKNAKILASLKILIKTGVLNLQMIIAEFFCAFRKLNRILKDGNLQWMEKQFLKGFL